MTQAEFREPGTDQTEAQMQDEQTPTTGSETSASGEVMGAEERDSTGEDGR